MATDPMREQSIREMLHGQGLDICPNGQHIECDCLTCRLAAEIEGVIGAEDDALLAVLHKYEGQGTCANLNCDPFHMHDPECVWPQIMDLLAARRSAEEKR